MGKWVKTIGLIKVNCKDTELQIHSFFHGLWSLCRFKLVICSFFRLIWLFHVFEEKLHEYVDQSFSGLCMQIYQFRNLGFKCSLLWHLGSTVSSLRNTMTIDRYRRVTVQSQCVNIRWWFSITIVHIYHMMRYCNNYLFFAFFQMESSSECVSVGIVPEGPFLILENRKNNTVFKSSLYCSSKQLLRRNLLPSYFRITEREVKR